MPWLVAAGVVIVLGALLYPSVVLAYVQGVSTQIEVAPIGGGFELRADAARAFLAMKAAANADGVVLQVDSAFRTMTEQITLWGQLQRGERTDAVARPGYSNHQSGIAVDIAVGRSTQSQAYLWLAQNAAGFGFINTGSSFGEPWHWEYRNG